MSSSSLMCQVHVSFGFNSDQIFGFETDRHTQIQLIGAPHIPCLWVLDDTFGVFDPIHEPNNLQDGYGLMHMLSSYMFTCKLY